MSENPTNALIAESISIVQSVHEEESAAHNVLIISQADTQGLFSNSKYMATGSYDYILGCYNIHITNFNWNSPKNYEALTAYKTLGGWLGMQH